MSRKMRAVALATVVLLGTAVPAQDRDPTPQRGFQPAGSYSISEIESINTVNGNLGLSIPIAKLPPGRAGLTAGVNVIYNSKVWDIRWDYSQSHPTTLEPLLTSNLEPSLEGGWRYGVDYILEPKEERPNINPNGQWPCDGDLRNYRIFKLKITFPDGSQHLLRPQPARDTTGQWITFNDFFGDGYYEVTRDGYRHHPCESKPRIADPMTYYTMDGTYVRLEVAHDDDIDESNNAWTLYFPDGRRVVSAPGEPQRIYDANGNSLRVYSFEWNGHPVKQLLDDQDRAILIEFGCAASQDCIYAPAAGAWEVIWRINRGAIRIHDKWYQCTDAGNMCLLDKWLNTIRSIAVPPEIPGSLAYNFDYSDNTPNGAKPAENGWGELNYVRLPSGAETSYHYFRDNAGSHWEHVMDNYPDRKELVLTESYDGATETRPPESWTFTIQNTSSQITAPDGGITSQNFNDPKIPHQNSEPGLVYRTDLPDGSRIERVWVENIPAGANVGPTNNPVIKTEFRSLKDFAGNLVLTSAKNFTYDKNGNVTSVAEYDWMSPSVITRDGNGKPTGFAPSSSPLRVTVSTYYNPTPDSSDQTTDDADVYHKTGSVQRKNAVASTELQAASVARSRTEFTYDDPNDSGNLTLEKRWDSTKGAYSNPLGAGNSVSVSHTYDPFGNRTLSTDARGYQTRFSYGAVCGTTNLYATTAEQAVGQPEERTTDYVYDCRSGLTTAVTDVDNTVTTRTAYDVLGRPTLVEEADGSGVERQTATHYSDAERRVITRSDLSAIADGKLVTVERYDQLGRIRLRQQIENKDSECPTNTNCPETGGIKVQTRYRTSGAENYTLVSNPFRATTSGGAGTETTMGWTRTVRDRGGRTIEVDNYGGSALPFPWGSNNPTASSFTSYEQNLTTVTDPNSRTRRHQTDALGRRTAVTENPFSAFGDAAYTTSYSYDAHDNLTTVTQGAQTRTFVYDSLSRLSSATNPESGTVSYSSYDGNGNLLQKSDARGIVTTMTYDGLNRVRTRSYNDGTPSVTYTYDQVHLAGSKARGRLTTVSSSVSTYKYEKYDELGRVTQANQTTGSVNATMTFGFDRAGGVTSVGYPAGRVVSPVYDTAGRLSGVTGYASGMLYASHNALREVTLGNGLVQTTSFNNRLQPTSIVVNPANALVNLSYSYYANGNVLNHTIIAPGLSARSQDFDYDAFNRLKIAVENRSGAINCPDAGSTWCEKYAFDQYGNRWVAATSGFTQTAVTPTAQSAFSASDNRLVGNGYDAAGNQTSALGAQFEYDAENRQKKARIPASLAAGGSQLQDSTYEYDGDGRRVRKTVQAYTGTYVYDPAGKLLTEYRNGSWLKDFVYAGDGLLAMEDSAGRSYLTQDHLGSTRVVTNSAGNVESRHDYLPFGKEVPDIGGRSSAIGYTAHQNPAQQNVLQRFTGQELDPESGLQYFSARYYSGRQGRFTSPDETLLDQWEDDPQSWNLYAYVRGNPLTFTDPSGQQTILQPECEPTKTEGEEGQRCRIRITVVEDKRGLSPLDRLWLAGILGHHGLPGWRQLPKTSDAYSFFRQWTTGRLIDPTVNYYDKLHRAYNERVARIVANYVSSRGIAAGGAGGVVALQKNEIRELARKIIMSRAPEIRAFLTRLEAANAGARATLLNSIKSIRFTGAPLFLVPGQAQMIQCRMGNCYGPDEMSF